MIDKQKAIALKESGLTNKEVAEVLGCSEVWCKTNLKGVKKKDIAPEDLLYLQEKGKGKDCITTGEIYSKLLPVPDNKDQKKEKQLALRRTKDKLKEDKEVIIRQAWIHPQRARFSYNNMLCYINDLNDRLDEYVRMHLTECGFTKEEIDEGRLYNSSLHFMVKNSIFGAVSGTYHAGIFQGVDNSVDKIEERIQQLDEGVSLLEASAFDLQGIDLPY